MLRSIPWLLLSSLGAAIACDGDTASNGAFGDAGDRTSDAGRGDAPGADDDAADDDDVPADDDATDDDVPADDDATDDDATDDDVPADDDATDDDVPADDDDATDDDVPADDDATDDDVPADDDATDDDATDDDVPANDDAETDAGPDDDAGAPTEPSRFLLSVEPSNVLGEVSQGEARCTFGSPCAALFDAGVEVTLEAQPGRNMEFLGWETLEGDAPACDGASCTVTITGALSLRAAFGSPHNLAFFSEALPAADLGGLDGADRLCNDDATSAGLPGTYRAWLSTSAVDALDRFPAAAGWLRLDGYPVALAGTNLDDGVLMPIALSSLGKRAWTNAWTATGVDGAAFGSRPGWDGTGGQVPLGACEDWTSAEAEVPGTETPAFVTMGSTAHAGGQWTDASVFACDVVASLFCLGVDPAEPVGLETSAGRLAFVTEGSYFPGGGIEDADALCAAEATAAGLSGSYLAMLGSSGGAAISRFDLAGPAWHRVDGVPLVHAAADLGDENAILTSLNVQADGTTLVSIDSFDSFAYTGGPFGLTPPAASACDDWTNTTSDGFALMGNPQGAYENAAGCCSGGCDQGRRLFCFEE